MREQIRDKERLRHILDAIGLIINGYTKEVINKLPMEFAVEARKLLRVSLEGGVG